MALTFRWSSLVVEADASITDLAAFHAELRAAEQTATGMTYPVIHRWKALDLGGGAAFYQADFINGWQLKFPAAGNYVISGNLNAAIVPVAGVYVERKTSAAFSTTAVGGSGPTAAEIASAVMAAIQTGVVPANVVQVHGQTINGSGTEADPWGP